jgi:hypothetical protein
MGRLWERRAEALLAERGDTEVGIRVDDAPE